MSSETNNFIPEDYVIPEDYQEAQLFLKKTLESFARMINRKDTAQYETVEAQVNHTYPGTAPQIKEDIFRKIVNFGALPNAATKTVAHGLTVNDNWFFTRIEAFAHSQADNRFIPVPNFGAFNSALWVTYTDVNIAATFDLSNYTRCYVILEYYKG